MGRTRSALAALALLAAGCGESPREEAPASTTPSAPPARVVVKPPPTGPEVLSPMGVYRFESAELKITLFLDADGHFRLVSHRSSDQEQRTATGRWVLQSRTLRMTYETVNGDPVEESDTAVNRIAGDGRVMLKAEGGEYPLTKQKVLDVR